MRREKYNTNLASEFYVLSVLHRLGIDAMLTLGNKKSVDILAVNSEGKTFTIDVKGLAGKTAWPIDNIKLDLENHIIVFVCYRDEIDNPGVLPEVWIIPCESLMPFVYNSPNGRRTVQRSKLIKEADKFKDSWHLIR